MIPSPNLSKGELNDARFDYDTSDDLNIHETGEEVFDGMSVHDINFRGATGRRISAYMAAPIVGRSLPGILFVHPAPGSRYSFLQEALRLTEKGICSILVDAPWSAGMEWGRTMGEPEHDRREFIGAVKDLRRALDVLLTATVVDRNRLGFVGHSLGALCGGILSGIEPRIRTFVLMSGAASYSDVMAANNPGFQGEMIAAYDETVSEIDPIRFVPHAAPASIMFQIGRRDEYFDPARMQELADAASEPKVVNWYASGHALDEQACSDRALWLIGELFR
jgi:uncharacterized protein